MTRSAMGATDMTDEAMDAEHFRELSAAMDDAARRTGTNPEYLPFVRGTVIDAAVHIIRAHSIQQQGNTTTLIPRLDGDRSGLAYADAILALKGPNHG